MNERLEVTEEESIGTISAFDDIDDADAARERGVIVILAASVGGFLVVWGVEAESLFIHAAAVAKCGGLDLTRRRFLGIFLITFFWDVFVGIVFSL